MKFKMKGEYWAGFVRDTIREVLLDPLLRTLEGTTLRGWIERNSTPLSRCMVALKTYPRMVQE